MLNEVRTGWVTDWICNCQQKTITEWECIWRDSKGISTRLSASLVDMKININHYWKIFPSCNDTSRQYSCMEQHRVLAKLGQLKKIGPKSAKWKGTVGRRNENCNCRMADSILKQFKRSLQGKSKVFYGKLHNAISGMKAEVGVGRVLLIKQHQRNDVWTQHANLVPWLSNKHECLK